MASSYAGAGRPSDGSTVPRIADLHLRGGNGPIRSRAYWPPAAAGAGVRPVVVVFFRAGGARPGGAHGADELCRWLCLAAGVVIVAPGRAAFQDAVTTTEWAADHTAELAADPARLLVAGEGDGGGLAAAVALQVRDHGWPPVTRQVLIRPNLSTGAVALPAESPAPGSRGRSLAGVAPATLVGGEQYAGQLRRAGVAVEQVRYRDLARALRHHLASRPSGALESSLDKREEKEP